ncbi:preprotein translocase subunit SecE [Candidatus Beckwithbacteria bacterium]|nr:preprotein translocase subunit SecE [Candidatus Beckwithbacteria bacterium]
MDTNFTVPDFGSNPIEYLKQVRIELKKVDWPKKDLIIKSTILVLVVSIIIGTFLGGLDFGFTKLFAYLLQNFK